MDTGHDRGGRRGGRGPSASRGGFSRPWNPRGRGSSSSPWHVRGRSSSSSMEITPASTAPGKKDGGVGESVVVPQDPFAMGKHENPIPKDPFRSSGAFNTGIDPFGTPATKDSASAEAIFQKQAGYRNPSNPFGASALKSLPIAPVDPFSPPDRDEGQIPATLVPKEEAISKPKEASSDFQKYRGPDVLITYIPEAFNDENTLKRHFETCVPGKLKHISLRRNRRSAIATFATQKDAMLAMKTGRLIGEARVPLRMSYYVPPDIQRIRRELGEQEEKVRISTTEPEQAPAEAEAAAMQEIDEVDDIVAEGASKSDEAATVEEYPQDLRGDPDMRVDPDVKEKRKNRFLVTGLRKREEELKAEQKPSSAPKVELDEASSIVGTCMDMCPAEERKNREAQRDLSVFEILGGYVIHGPRDHPKVDHSKAVKKYARSAAASEAVKPEMVRSAYFSLPYSDSDMLLFSFLARSGLLLF